MPSIYLTSNGKLSKKGETLQFYHHEGTVSTIFPYKTEQLVVLGNMTISSGALQLLMKYHIETVFLNKNGLFNGKLEFQENKNVFLRKKQFLLSDNHDFCMRFAKSVALGKVQNQLTFVRRIGRKKGSRQVVNYDKLQEVTQRIERLLKKIPEAESVNTLRGYEGTAARFYFSIFRQNIVQDWAEFKGRSMNPPEDNVNAVLSFIYTLLFYRIDSAITAAGLDPYVGIFHSINYGKHALAFDLMEEFRVVIGDMLTCALFNLGVLKEDDFLRVVFSKKSSDYPIEITDEDDGVIGSADEKSGVLLTKEGIRKVVGQFEKKLDSNVLYEPLGRQLSYRSIIKEQAKHFKRTITGEEEGYRTLVLK
jgi:CRISP-associated protein Cas1